MFCAHGLWHDGYSKLFTSNSNSLSDVHVRHRDMWRGELIGAGELASLGVASGTSEMVRTCANMYVCVCLHDWVMCLNFCVCFVVGLSVIE